MPEQTPAGRPTGSHVIGGSTTQGSVGMDPRLIVVCVSCPRLIVNQTPASPPVKLPMKFLPPKHKKGGLTLHASVESICSSALSPFHRRESVTSDDTELCIPS